MCSLVFDEVLEVIDLISQGLHLRDMDLFHVLLQSRSQPKECIAFTAFEAACLGEPSRIRPMQLARLMGWMAGNTIAVPFASGCVRTLWNHNAYYLQSGDHQRVNGLGGPPVGRQRRH